MRVFSTLIILTLLAGCNSDFAAEKTSVEKEKSDAKFARERELMERSEMQRSALTSKGQGCPGRVLQNEELRQAVAGKFEYNSQIDHANSYTYHSDGRYETVNGFTTSTNIGRYWVDSDQLCHDHYNGRKIKWCFRIIEINKLKPMREILDDRIHNAITLGCVSSELKELELKNDN